MTLYPWRWGAPRNPITGHRRLLRARRERPCRRAAKQSNERAPLPLDHLVGEREQFIWNLEYPTPWQS